MSGGEWAAVITAATAAFTATILPGLRWLLQREHERGRADAYQEQTKKTIAEKDGEIHEKDALISDLRAALASLAATRKERRP